VYRAQYLTETNVLTQKTKQRKGFAFTNFSVSLEHVLKVELYCKLLAGICEEQLSYKRFCSVLKSQLTIDLHSSNILAATGHKKSSSSSGCENPTNQLFGKTGGNQVCRYCITFM